MGLRIGVLHAKSLIWSRHVWCNGLHWNGWLLLQMDSRGDVYADMSGMKCAKYFTSPTNHNTSGYDLRVCHLHTLAILLVLAWRPWSSIRCPRQSMSDEYRSSFDWLIYSQCFLRIENTICRCSLCSHIVFEKINISSRYTCTRAWGGLEISMSCEVTDAPAHCNHPAWQRIFRDHLRLFVQVYLDDIFIFSNTIWEHKEHLQIVFSILRKHWLYISQSKTGSVLIGHGLPWTSNRWPRPPCQHQQDGKGMQMAHP